MPRIDHSCRRLWITPRDPRLAPLRLLNLSSNSAGPMPSFTRKARRAIIFGSSRGCFSAAFLQQVAGPRLQRSPV